MLWKKFHVASVHQLEELVRKHKLCKLRGFGEKSELKILKAAEQYKHLLRAPADFTSMSQTMKRET